MHGGGLLRWRRKHSGVKGGKARIRPLEMPAFSGRLRIVAGPLTLRVVVLVMMLLQLGQAGFLPRLLLGDGTTWGET